MYTHYITTPEEYNVQRYEAASTIYGPNTLATYQKYLDAFSQGDNTVENDISPQEIDLYDMWAFLPDSGIDYLVPGAEYGLLLSESYSKNGGKFTFYASNPRHGNSLIQYSNSENSIDSFFEIYKIEDDGSQTLLSDDNSFDTRLWWDYADPTNDADLKNLGLQMSSAKPCRSQNVLEPEDDYVNMLFRYSNAQHGFDISGEEFYIK